MITLYSGTPGSGKSYHAAVVIERMMHYGGSVICNFPVRVPPNVHPRKPFLCSYWDNSEITPERLAEYARQHHAVGKEGQTLVVVDEAQVIWNCRDFTSRDRRSWITFFSQHRKLGFDLLLISQNDRMLDRQIRMLIEYEIKHRKINNYGAGGKILSLLTGMSTWFVAIQYWYGGNKLMLGREMIRYRQSIGNIYDSYALFSGDKTGVQPDPELISSVSAACNVVSPRRGLLIPFTRATTHGRKDEEAEGGAVSREIAQQPEGAEGGAVSREIAQQPEGAEGGAVSREIAPDAGRAL